MPPYAPLEKLAAQANSMTEPAARSFIAVYWSVDTTAAVAAAVYGIVIGIIVFLTAAAVLTELEKRGI